MLPLRRASLTSSFARRSRVRGRDWSRVIQAASKLHTLRQRRRASNSGCTLNAAAITPTTTAAAAAAARLSCDATHQAAFQSRSFAKVGRSVPAGARLQLVEPWGRCCSNGRSWRSASSATSTFTGTRNPTRSASTSTATSTSTGTLNPTRSGSTSTATSTSTLNPTRSASTATSTSNGTLNPTRSATSTLDALRQQLQARSRELGEGSPSAAWWDDTQLLLEQLVTHASRHGHGHSSAQVSASASQWDLCLEFLSDAQEQRVPVPTAVIASLMNEAHTQELWRRCLEVFKGSSVGAGSGSLPAEQYSGRTSTLDFVLEKTATATKDEDGGLVAYEMLVANPFASGPSGNSSAQDPDESRLEKLLMYQQAIAACRHLEHWGFALEILQACEVLYSAASGSSTTAVDGDAARTGEPEVGSHTDTHLRYLFSGCVCEALFACSSAHEWDRAILVFLRGLEVLDGLDLCAQPALMKEVAYCCGQSGQWSTSLRVLDVVFDAFLQYDEADECFQKPSKQKKKSAKKTHSALIGPDGVRQGVAIRPNSYAAALSYSIADVEDLCATMYRNVIKACRNAKQYTLAQQIFAEVRSMYLAHAAATRQQTSEQSSTGQLALPPDPFVFCEMMIAYKEMRRPWDVLHAFSDLMELSFPEHAKHQRALASRSKSGNARAQLVRDAQQRKSAAFNRNRQSSHQDHGHRVGAPRRDSQKSKPLIVSASAIQQLPSIDGDNCRLWGSAVDARLFRLLCATHYQLRHWDDVDALFDLMLERGAQPTRLVYNLAISANIKRNDANRAIHVFENMLTHCAQPPSEVTVNALLSCLANAGRTSEILFLFEQLPALEISPNAITLNHMIGTGIAVGDTHLVDRSLNQALHEGHPLSAGTLPTLLDSLATPAMGEPFLSVEELERLDQVLNHAREHGTNTKGDARGPEEQEMRQTNSGSARMRRPTHSGETRDSKLKLPTDVLHNMVDRNAKGKGQRWRALGDLIGLLVDRHGLRLRGATWNRAVKRLERAVRDAHAGSELSEEAQAALSYVLELRERSLQFSGLTYTRF